MLWFNKSALGTRRTWLPRLLGRHGSTDRTRGQALVELAIVAPVLLVLVLAAIDLGRIYASQITVANAARAGAFEAAENPSTAATLSCHSHGSVSRAVCAAVNEAVNSFVSVTPADVQVTCNPSCAEAYGNRVTVSVTGHFELITPVMWVFTGGPNVTFRAEAQADVIEVPLSAGVSTPTPTATPTATPTSDPSASPGSSPSASASPTPSPTPPCVAPIVSFTWTQQNKNKPVVFTSTSTPTTGTCAITFWRWDYGDGQTDAGNVPKPSHTFPAQGTAYTVTLSVTNPAGVFSASAVVTTK